MRQKRNSRPRARSINIDTKTQRMLRAHMLMDEVIELADSGADDLELLKIKIAARQWAADRLLALCESEDQPREEEPEARATFELSGGTAEDFARLADNNSFQLITPQDTRIQAGNQMLRSLSLMR